ncbi:MAG: glycine/betaine/sarcosine/D-proline family reductase selenoprotein B [Chloroflexi bacterium]|nr:glycine/betaine/sarcosine/D-proline family reductase selenoprotein B [Chloroflexota bacterium]
MPSELRVVHYVNQFFAGVGGEEKAGVAPGVLRGAVGPGRGLAQQFKGRANIVATLYCGDNYFQESPEVVREFVLDQLRSLAPGVLVAGPAFDAGRYGLACVDTCQLAATELGIPSVIGLAPSNAAVVAYRGYKNLKSFCVPTAESAAGMSDALAKMAQLAIRVGSGEPVGPAAQEGYIPRGVRLPARADHTGVERAVSMLLAKAGGTPFVSEVPIETPDLVAAAPPVKDLSRAKIAVVTTSGLVPEGNPDGFVFHNNLKWAKYSLADLRSMQEAKWEVRHNGYHTRFMLDNGNLGVPLDVLREMEDAGVFEELHDQYLAANNSAPFARHQAMGREMAADLQAAGVDGVLLVST